MPSTPEVWLEEFIVNASGTTGTQLNAKITQLSNGYILVTWVTSESMSSTNNGGYEIHGQMFDPAGNPIHRFNGETGFHEFQLNSTWRVDDQTDHEIYPLEGDGFIIVYEDASTSGLSLRLERFGNTATSSTDSETIFLDNSGTAPNSFNPVVAVSGTSVMIAYQKFLGGTNTDIMYRIYDTGTTINGTLGPETISINAANHNRDPQIAVLENGNFLTVARNSNGDSSIVFNIRDTTGASVVPVTQVADTDTNGDVDLAPSVTALTGGGFVISWENTDTETGVEFQIYNSDGTTSGGVQTVNLAVAGSSHDTVSMAALADGGFVVLVDIADSVGVLQRYDSAGNTVGDDIVINSGADFDASDIELLSDGRLALAYVGGNGEINMQFIDVRDSVTTDVYGNVFGTTGNENFLFESNYDVDLGLDFYLGPGDDYMSRSSRINNGQIFDGGTGTDRLSTSSTGGVQTIDLVAGTLTSSAVPGATEYIRNFENISAGGTSIITGDGNDNVISTGSGDDWVSPGIGNDTVNLNDGNDTLRLLLGTQPSDMDILDGGDGSDLFSASGSINESWTINLTAETADYSNGYSASLIDFENVATALGDDSIVGNAEDNHINSGAGDDIVLGLDGNDVLLGFGGADELYGGNGDDILYDYALGVGTHIVNGNAGVDTWYLWSLESTGAATSADWTVDLAAATATDGAYTMQVILIENVTSGNGADTIIGTSGDNILNGWGGNDILIGGDGNDTLIGSAGSDILRGGTGVDSFDGGSFSDTIDYSMSTATFNFDPGTLLLLENGQQEIYASIESFHFGAGDDFFDLTTGRFIEVKGGGGNDSFLFAPANSQKTLDGESGIDTLQLFHSTGLRIDLLTETISEASSGNSVSYVLNFENIIGTDFDDEIIGNGLANNLMGGLGDDIILGGGGADVINAGDGNDWVSGGFSSDQMDGGDGVDTVDYTYSSADLTIDLLNGLAYGTAAGPGGETIVNFEDVNMGAGNDTVIGNDLDNRLSGGGGDDTLDGGDGRDRLEGGDGEDILTGGADTDFLLGGGSRDRMFGGDQSDRMFGQDGNDIMNGGGSNDIMYGGGNADIMYGGLGNDDINGGSNVDRLYGQENNDTIYGGNAGDQIDGGSGNDMLYGGNRGGADGFGDTFIFANNFGTDVIGDFENGLDVIDFSGHTGINDFNDVLARASEDGTSLLIATNANNTLIIENFSMAELDASDFVF